MHFENEIEHKILVTYVIAKVSDDTQMIHYLRELVIFKYSGLNLNQYVVASPCRTICTVCGFVALS